MRALERWSVGTSEGVNRYGCDPHKAGEQRADRIVVEEMKPCRTRLVKATGLWQIMKAFIVVSCATHRERSRLVTTTGEECVMNMLIAYVHLETPVNIDLSPCHGSGPLRR